MQTQVATIQYLIEKHHLNPKEAIKEVNELPRQCCQALKELYLLGLRGEHFRQKGMIKKIGHYDYHDNNFISDAIISLVRDQHLPIDMALDQIKLIENNALYVRTLGKTYHFGLRAQDFIYYKSTTWFNDFTYSHSDAMIHLMEKHSLAPIDAFKEVSNSSADEVYAVKELYAFGLRRSMLRNWKDFHFMHLEILSTFIKIEKMPLNKALDRLATMKEKDMDEFKRSYSQFKKHQFLVVLGLFGRGDSSLKKLSGDEIFDANAIKIVFDYLRPTA